MNALYKTRKLEKEVDQADSNEMQQIVKIVHRKIKLHFKNEKIL